MQIIIISYAHTKIHACICSKIGLGDRHPSNLMLNRFTGKVLHIDFGDCFEVAMHRDKFPEKVPFRLTRMLVNAMEVSGIEGGSSTYLFIHALHTYIHTYFIHSFINLMIHILIHVCIHPYMYRELSTNM